MDILLQSDGQLYPPRTIKTAPKPPPPPKPPEPTPEKTPALQGIPWEELLLVAVAYVLLKNSDQPDLPLLFALAYILFDQNFSIKNFL